MKIKGIYIEIINKCNLKCPYCYNDSKIDNKLSCISRSKWDELVEFCKENKIRVITISGGEPMLHPDLKYFIESANLKDIQINLISNVGLNNFNFKDFFIKNNTLQLTLDSAFEDKHDLYRGIGNFKKVITTISENKNYLDKIYLRINLKKNNINELEDIYSLSESLSLKRVQFNYINSNGRASTLGEVIDVFDIELHNDILNKVNGFTKISNKCKYSIGTPASSLVCPLNTQNTLSLFPKIDYNGQVFFCQAFSKESFGNINEESFNSIFSKKIEKNLKKIINDREKMKKCYNCIFNGICKGGCLSEDNGSNNQFCNYYKKVVIASLKELKHDC